MRATIHTFLPGTIGLVLLQRTHWAIVSAERPADPRYSASLNRRINEMRTSHLRRTCARFGVEQYPVVGVYGGALEDASLILNVSEQEAFELGVFYRQETVLLPRGLASCATGVITPAVDVVEIPRGYKSDHTYLPATGACFAVRFAVPQPQVTEKTA